MTTARTYASVWDAIADTPGQAANLRTRAELMRQVVATIRAKDLAQQLLTFSRGGVPVKAVINIGPIIKEAARFALSGAPVQCTIALPPDLWLVEADAGSDVLAEMRQQLPNPLRVQRPKRLEPSRRTVAWTATDRRSASTAF